LLANVLRNGSNYLPRVFVDRLAGVLALVALRVVVFDFVERLAVVVFFLVAISFGSSTGVNSHSLFSARPCRKQPSASCEAANRSGGPRSDRPSDLQL
jgi:hypothetical protein